jgi:transcription antitermination factor NusG
VPARQEEAFVRPAWYAVYTASRCERRIAAQLTGFGVESYLPLLHEIHRWNKRNAEVDVPAFPGYVFARFALKDRDVIMRTSGVVYLVGFPAGVPTEIPSEEIEALRLGLLSGAAAPCAFIARGARVRVRCGVLTGLEGILERRKERFRVVLSLSLLQRSVAVEVDERDLEEV